MGEKLFEWFRNNIDFKEILPLLPDEISDKPDEIQDTYHIYEKANLKYHIDFCNAILKFKPSEKIILQWKSEYVQQLSVLNKNYPIPVIKFNELVDSINNAFFRLESYMNGSLKEYSYYGFYDYFAILFIEAKKSHNFTLSNCQLISQYWALTEQISVDYDKSDFTNQDAYDNVDFCKDCEEIAFLNYHCIEDFNAFITQDEIDLANKKFSISEIIKNSDTNHSMANDKIKLDSNFSSSNYMNFEKSLIDKINNGMLRLSHYYNSISLDKPIYFSKDILRLLKLYQTDVKYRNENNLDFLKHISYWLLNFEYTYDKSNAANFDNKKLADIYEEYFSNIYVDGYNAALEINEYLEKTRPDLYTEDTDYVIYEPFIMKNQNQIIQSPGDSISLKESKSVEITISHSLYNQFVVLKNYIKPPFIKLKNEEDNLHHLPYLYPDYKNTLDPVKDSESIFYKIKTYFTNNAFSSEQTLILINNLIPIVENYGQDHINSFPINNHGHYYRPLMGFDDCDNFSLYIEELKKTIESIDKTRELLKSKISSFFIDLSSSNISINNINELFNKLQDISSTIVNNSTNSSGHHNNQVSKSFDKNSEISAKVFALFLYFLMDSKCEKYTRNVEDIRLLCEKYNYTKGHINIRQHLYNYNKKSKKNPLTKPNLISVIKLLKEYPDAVLKANEALVNFK